MMSSRRRLSHIKNDVVRALVIAEKDIRIYYLKPPTLMFGILFPLSMFLSFAVGRNVPPSALIPGLMAITVFFSSSSIGPVVIPWERRVKTFERFLSAPISLWAVLLGKTMAGFVFGLPISLIPLIIGYIGFGTQITDVLALTLGIGLSSLAFSAMGVMFASIPTENVGSVMVSQNFIRIPLIFVSGIYIPIQSMPEWLQSIAAVSPLTYSNDLIRYSLGGRTYYDPALSVVALLISFVIFLFVGMKLHERVKD